MGASGDHGPKEKRPDDSQTIESLRPVRTESKIIDLARPWTNGEGHYRSAGEPFASILLKQQWWVLCICSQTCRFIGFLLLAGRSVASGKCGLSADGRTVILIWLCRVMAEPCSAAHPISFPRLETFTVFSVSPAS